MEASALAATQVETSALASALAATLLEASALAAILVEASVLTATIVEASALAATLVEVTRCDFSGSSLKRSIVLLLFLKIRHLSLHQLLSLKGSSNATVLMVY